MAWVLHFQLKSSFFLKAMVFQFEDSCLQFFILGPVDSTRDQLGLQWLASIQQWLCFLHVKTTEWKMKALINQMFCLHHAQLLVRLNQHFSSPLIVLPKFRGTPNQWKDQNSSLFVEAKEINLARWQMLSLFNQILGHYNHNNI